MRGTETTSPLGADKNNGHRRQGMVVRLTMISVLLSSMIFVFDPFYLYSMNVDEFTFSLVDFYLFSLPLFFVSTLVLIGVGVGLSRWRVLSECYVVILFCVSMLTWIDGYLLAEDVVMEDQGFDFDLWSFKGLVDLALWFVLPPLAIFFRERLNRHVVFFAVSMMVIQSLGVAWSSVSRLEVWRAKPTIGDESASLRKLHGFSRERNVIHIVIDEMQSDLFAQTLRTGSSFYGEKLSGFTFFENCLANYAKTRMSVPSFLSSIPFVNKEPLDDYLDESYNARNVITLLMRKGYAADVLTVPPVMFDSGKYNVYTCGADFGVERVLADQGKWLLLDCVIHKRSPEFVKAIMCANPDAFTHRFLYPDAYHLTLNYFSSRRLVESLAERMTGDRVEPVYKFLHLMGAHDPCVLNEKGEYDPGAPLSRQRKRAVQQAFFFDVIVLFLDKLREAGIYDSSLIVIHSDHGGYTSVADAEGRNLHFAPDHPMGERLTGRVLPTLLVKPPGAKGHLAWSKAPVELTDVPATIVGRLGMDASFSGVDAFAATSGRTRRHYHLSREVNAWIYDRITEFSINGDMLDVDNWCLSRIHHCPKMKRDAPTYSMGSDVEMGEHGNYRTYFVRGWGDGAKGSWIMWRQAAIQLPMTESAVGDLVLRIEAAFRPDQAEAGTAVKVSAYVNGVIVGGEMVAEEGEKRMTFVVPFELVENAGNILITFFIRDMGGRSAREESNGVNVTRSLLFKRLALAPGNADVSKREK